MTGILATHKEKLFVIAGAIVLVVLGLFAFGVVTVPGTAEGSKSVDVLVAEALEECRDAPVTQTCYEERIPDLVSGYSMDTVFEVVRRVTNRDTTYQYCHVLAHKIGERETAKDPSQWMDVIASCPTDGLCSNGCMHGASVERFSNETLNSHQLEMAIEELKVACEPRPGWNPSELDSSICYHGLGHLAVHMTAADIPRALKLCDAVSQGTEHKDRLCDEGVYMQLFQPLEPEDFALVDRLPEAPTKENIVEFCDAYGEADEKAACWREGWPTHREELQTAEGVVDFCSRGPEYNDEDRCYTTVMTINARGNLNRPEWMANFCSDLPGERRGECYEIGATAILEERRTDYETTVSFCERPETEEERAGCYEHLANYVTFVYSPNAPEARQFCTHLPEPWGEQCAGNLPNGSHPSTGAGVQ